MKIKAILASLVISLMPWIVPIGSVNAHETENFDFILGVDPIHGPVVSRAPNGDTIEIMGQGTLSIHPKSVTGGGTVVHKDPDGNVVGTGTWTAERLLSYRSWGTTEGFPENFEGGRAIIKVSLNPDGLDEDFIGILRFDCLIGDVPGGAAEGARLSIRGGPNFNREVSGDTLFIRTD